jgi:2-polyprenyl-3-methyl-5-hydroxy-6-metoxy-1,4-benzoquinol methylase
MDRRSHWENVYHTKQPTEVSWFEAEPTTSLALIQCVAPRGGRIIDVGGGASLLVDRLLAAGKWEVTVLDISAAALELAQTRLGDKAHRVQWIQADITEIQQLGTFDLWHDRAVFHFLTAPEDRTAYLSRLHHALRPGGHVVLGTFALQGPEKCSGLPVCRYDAQSLAATLGAAYSLVHTVEHSHATPAGKTQRFTYSVFQKVLT